MPVDDAGTEHHPGTCPGWVSFGQRQGLAEFLYRALYFSPSALTLFGSADQSRGSCGFRFVVAATRKVS
ncbi:MAG: hypothetical protein ACXADB_11915, partial [Candidatus Hermodarchaeia archaeon]